MGTSTRAVLEMLNTTREPVCAQEMDFEILHESQLLEKLLQFADEAVCPITLQCKRLLEGLPHPSCIATNAVWHAVLTERDAP